MSVSEPERAGPKKGAQFPTSASPADNDNPLTRLWQGADASYGHQVEAVAEVRERKRREQGGPRSRHRWPRGGRPAQPEAKPLECERCRRTVRRASSERVEIPSPVGEPATHLLCPRCADEVRGGLLRLLAGQEPRSASGPDERDVPPSIPARAGWFAFRMIAYGLIALTAFTLVTWLVLR